MRLTAEVPPARLQLGSEPARRPAASASPLLLLLLAGDALFVLLHLAHVATPVFQDPGFSLELERGFGEVYQYLKEYWIALLLLVVGLRQGAPVLVAWAGLFGYLLVDDAFALHERLGAAISGSLALPDGWPLRDRDVGEVLVAGAVGVLALAAIGVAHALSEPPARQVSRRLLRLLALLALFGVGVDAVHQMFAPGVWYTALGVVEDGGEMVVMTAVVWLAARLYRGNL